MLYLCRELKNKNATCGEIGRRAVKRTESCYKDFNRNFLCIGSRFIVGSNPTKLPNIRRLTATIKNNKLVNCHVQMSSVFFLNLQL